MAVEDFIRAMPKVDLRVRLEGAFRKETLMFIAEENEIGASTKGFAQWVALLDKPDYTRLDDLITTVHQWLQQPEDLTRIVYDLGVHLSKQNVRYAEVVVNPHLHVLPGMSFEDCMNALVDGRDRAQRGWGVRMNWILAIPRGEPRRSDEIIRWATSATGKRSGVVALGLFGNEEAQPASQFERVFAAAQKKDLPRVVQAGDLLEAEGILTAIDHLQPNRIYDARGAADAPDVLQRLVNDEIVLDICVARALCLGWVPTYRDYPLRRLLNAGVRLTISSDMPSLYKSSLTDEYLALVEHCEVSLDGLEEIALNAVRCCFLPDDEKQTMITEFREAYTRLRAEHTATTTA